jgi:hypothetical protein
LYCIFWWTCVSHSFLSHFSITLYFFI